jgi:hypothetical protein
MIEYYDSPSVTTAIKYFLGMVDSGVDPAHAFKIVTTQNVGVPKQ